MTAAFFAAVSGCSAASSASSTRGDPHRAARISAARVAAAFGSRPRAMRWSRATTGSRRAMRASAFPRRLGFAIPFVSYAFNFNLGAMVGALGFRYRLYSREGVDAKRIGAIAAFSIVTNWCGCLTVLGAMLIADPSALRVGWGLWPTAGRLLGVLALAPVAAYLVVDRDPQHADSFPRDAAIRCRALIRARADRPGQRILAAGSARRSMRCSRRSATIRILADCGGLRRSPLWAGSSCGFRQVSA